MTIRVPDTVLFRDLAGEGVLLDLTSGTYFGLDEIGARIWRLLAEHGDVEAVVRTILAEYDVEETRLRQDLLLLIRRLQEKGLIQADATDTATTG
jgi:hypothetical protein